MFSVKKNYATRFLAALMAVSLLSGCAILGGGGDDKKKETPTLGKRTNILTGESGAEVDPALAGISVILPAASANADWPQSGGNAGKSIGHVALGATPTRVWTANIDGSSKRARLAAAPVVSGGRLYAIDTEAVVHAFDAVTGAKAWSMQIEVKGDGSSSVFGWRCQCAGHDGLRHGMVSVMSLRSTRMMAFRPGKCARQDRCADRQLFPMAMSM